MSMFMLQLIHWGSPRSRAFLMVIVIMLHPRTMQNGVWFPGILQAAAKLRRGNVKEFSARLWLLLSAGRAARRAGGKQLPDCCLSSCSVQSSHASPPAPCPSRTPGADRAGYLCHVQTTKAGGEWSQHSLCRGEHYQKSLLMACQVVNKNHLNFVYHTAIKDAHYPVGHDYTRLLEKSRLGWGVSCSGLSPAAITHQEWLCLLSGSLL